MKKAFLCSLVSILVISFRALAFPVLSESMEQPFSVMEQQFFIENKGQWPDEVLYLTRIGGVDFWITENGLNCVFYQLEKDLKTLGLKDKNIPKNKYEHNLYNYKLLGHRVITEYIDANPHPSTEGKLKQEGYYNFFIGNDQTKHVANVSLYKEVVVKNLYNGIDIKYYFENSHLRYDYIVHPGADPSQIRFRLSGPNSSYLKDKNLTFTTRFGEVELSDLYTYQDKKCVKSSFVHHDDFWQISIEKYNPNKLLIIDPLIYSGCVGGIAGASAHGISIDESGSAYITGLTYSIDYSTTPGAFQENKLGADGFVTKINPAGTALVYSTFLGGSDEDQANDIAVDAIGNAYITGYTYSTNFPTTTGAFQTTYGGGIAKDVFVTKLNETGTGLIYSSFIGGGEWDSGEGIVINNNGEAYISGTTKSTNFPITPGAYKTTLIGATYDIFVTKLNANGSGLVYSTFIGGNKAEHGLDIVIDGSGNTFVAGITLADGDGWNILISKLNGTGSDLLYSFSFGGNEDEQAFGITIDGSGNTYITGYTESTNFPITNGAFQTTLLDNQNGDIFVSKINESGTEFIYSTYLGGVFQDWGLGIAIDESNNAYITGVTKSTNYPTTPDALQGIFGGGVKGFDALITKVNSTGTGLLYSSYIGGGGSDEGYDIKLDINGNTYISGGTQLDNFPITPGAFLTTSIAGAFVTKLNLSGSVDTQENFSDNSVFSIYPNPNSGQFNIHSEKGGIFDLTDMTGKALRTYYIKSTQKTIYESLPSGIYFIHERETGNARKIIIN